VAGESAASMGTRSMFI